jgi:hypothetical protein
MCGSVIETDINMFHKFFKSDLLFLTHDKVITVRMALARLLMSYPAIANDPEV